MARIRLCNQPSVGILQWARALAQPQRRTPRHAHFEGRRAIGTISGRSAIALACDALRLSPEDEVLVPAYSCGTEHDALLRQQVALRPYSIDRSCRFDLDELKSKRTARTKCVYVTHFFGWSQDLPLLRRWTREEGLSLVEDCALALFSADEDGALGRGGDAAVFSLPKTLGSIHGGVLSLDPATAGGLPLLAPAGASVLVRELTSGLRAEAWRVVESAGLVGFARRTKSARRRESTASDEVQSFPDIPADYYFEERHWRRACRPEAESLLCSVDPVQIVARRRHNFGLLGRLLREACGVAPLVGDLPSGVCPLCLPIACPGRDRVVRRLYERGVSAIPWWSGFHRSSVNWSEFPDAAWLKRSVVCLPVHQHLDASDMSYIAAEVRSALCDDSTGRGGRPGALQR